MFTNGKYVHVILKTWNQIGYHHPHLFSASHWFSGVLVFFVELSKIQLHKDVIGRNVAHQELAQISRLCGIQQMSAIGVSLENVKYPASTLWVHCSTLGSLAQVWEPHCLNHCDPKYSGRCMAHWLVPCSGFFGCWAHACLINTVNRMQIIIGNNEDLQKKFSGTPDNVHLYL